MLESCVQPQIFHPERPIMLRLIYERHTPISNGAILIEPVKQITDYHPVCLATFRYTVTLLDNIFI